MSTTTEPTVTHPAWCDAARCDEARAGALDVVHRGAEREARFAHAAFSAEAIDVRVQLTRSATADGADTLEGLDLVAVDVVGDTLLTVAQLGELGAWLLARAQEYRVH